MGTYMYCQLKGTSDHHIEQCNNELEKLGFKTEIYEGIKYGAFTTHKRLEEDARFMNEDPEGLKQCPHFERPITPELLQQFFWNKIGRFCTKLSGGRSNEELNQALIVAKWAAKNKLLVDQIESSNHTPGIVKSYLL